MRAIIHIKQVDIVYIKYQKMLYLGGGNGMNNTQEKTETMKKCPKGHGSFASLYCTKCGEPLIPIDMQTPINPGEKPMTEQDRIDRQNAEMRAEAAGREAKTFAIIEAIALFVPYVGIIAYLIIAHIAGKKIKYAEGITPPGFVNEPLKTAKTIDRVMTVICVVGVVLFVIVLVAIFGWSGLWRLLF
jgi:hypothetical protein